VGAAHRIRVEEEEVRGHDVHRDPASTCLVSATQIGSRSRGGSGTQQPMGSWIDALEAGGADQIKVMEETQGRGTRQDPASMCLGMASQIRSATTRRSAREAM
jgi:hypothetical protein